VPTRLLASRFGSRWTYSGHGVAPGQIPSDRMLRAFRFRDVGERTTLYAVVGHDAVQSLAPVLFNAAFADAGVDAVAVPLHMSDFEDFMHFAETFGMAGAAIDAQFAADAQAAAARAEERAGRTGVANTVRRVDTGWEAMRTAAVGRPLAGSMTAPGASAVEGLVWEAEQQFEWWTGRRPGAGVMREAALAETGYRATEAQSHAAAHGSGRRQAGKAGVD